MKLTLQQVRIASPCPVAWDSMTGNDRVRFCDQCKLHVYNLSGMTRSEGEALLSGHAGRMCARIYRRADGTILTADCPVGLARLRARAGTFAIRIAAAALSIATGTILARSRDRGPIDLEGIEPFATLTRWVRPGAAPTGGTWIAGDVCPPPSPAGGAR